MAFLISRLKQSSFYETLSHSKNYFISTISIKALSFISLPIMTRLLSPSDYGILNVFSGWQVIFISVLTLNCYTAVGRYYYDKQDDFREFFSTSVIFVLSLLSISFACFVLYKKQLSVLLGLPANTIIFCVPVVVFYTLNSWFEQIHVPQRHSKKITIRNVVDSYSGFGLSVLLIVLLDTNKYLGQIYATTIIGIIFSLYYFTDLKPFFKLSFTLKALKYSLSYSLPLLPYSLSGVILAQFDRIMVNKYSGYSDAGLYSFAYNIGMLLTIVLSAFHQAWVPDYFKNMDEKNYSRLDADIAKILNIVFIAALFLILFGREIGMILAKSNYHSSLVIVPIIVMGYIFYSIFSFYGWGMHYAKRNIYLSLTVVIAGATNIVLNMLFLPRYGYMAAAYTTAASYFLMVVIGVYVSQRVLKLYSPPLRNIGKSLFIMIPFIGGYYVLVYLDVNSVVNAIVKPLLLGMYSLLLFYRVLKVSSKETILDQSRNDP